MTAGRGTGTQMTRDKVRIGGGDARSGAYAPTSSVFSCVHLWTTKRCYNLWMNEPPAHLAAVHHDGSARYVSTAYPKLGDLVTLRIRTAPNAPIQAIYLATLPDGEQHYAPLKALPPTPTCRWWEVTTEVNMPVVTYRFVLFTSQGLWFYNGAGVFPYQPTDANNFRLIADYVAPQWVANSVFYQIFPDRFSDGDAGNNPTAPAYEMRRWDEPPGRANPSREFYGGDLQGVVERLPYLEALGVNALYLNPIFRAPSVHKYDVADFEQVDPQFGGNAALAALRQALTERGMRLMLDIVPNHCGSEHAWFQAALRDPQHPHGEHFIFTAYPEYVSWLGVRSLPKFNYQSQALRDYMWRAPDSIMRRWLQPPYSIDGWRVDVANMLGQYRETRLNAELSRELRTATKAENPEAYLLGENFFDATAQLQGDQYDANMNYRGFTTPLWDWLTAQNLRNPTITATLPPTQLSTAGLAAAWQAFRAPVPWMIALQQFTLVDSHDTARIRSLVGGNDGLHRLAAVLQFTYPGVPCLLYGDEIGLDGAGATEARRTMPWEEAAWNHDLLHFYRRLIALKRTSTALSSGGFQVLYTDDDTIAFLRDAPDDQLIVVGYRGAAVRAAGPLTVAHGAIPNGTHWEEMLTGATAVVADGALPLPALLQGGMIWRMQQ